MRKWMTPLALVVLAVCSALVLVVRYSAYLPLYGHHGPLPSATADEIELAERLRGHVTAVASVPHNTDHPEAYEAAAVYIEQQLEAMGYRFERQIYRAAEQNVRNIHIVVGVPRPGVPSFVVGAHYDSARISPGANDNGSGVAALIELARRLRGFRPERHVMRLAFFANEEEPFFGKETMGSRQFARMLVGQETVAGMISLETIGAYFDIPGSQKFPVPLNFLLSDRADFIAFVGMPAARELVHGAIGSFRRQTAFPSIGGVVHNSIKGVAWSDHASFHAVGVPALMITDTALFRYQHYHKTTDTPDKLNYDRLARVTAGVERMLREIVN